MFSAIRLIGCNTVHPDSWSCRNWLPTVFRATNPTKQTTTPFCVASFLYAYIGRSSHPSFSFPLCSLAHASILSIVIVVKLSDSFSIAAYPCPAKRAKQACRFLFSSPQRICLSLRFSSSATHHVRPSTTVFQCPTVFRSRFLAAALKLSLRRPLREAPETPKAACFKLRSVLEDSSQPAPSRAGSLAWNVLRRSELLVRLGTRTVSQSSTSGITEVILLDQHMAHTTMDTHLHLECTRPQV